MRTCSPWYASWSRLLSCLVISCLTVMWGCAHLVPSPPVKPFSQKEIASLITHLKDQEKNIQSFHGLGAASFKEGDREMEANLLIVGSRPLKMRLELTHPWGKPLIHMVADKECVLVLSLVDKKFFRGPPGALGPQQLFLFDADLDSVWKVLSGRVPILPHVKAASLKPREISLYDGQGEAIEIISFAPGSPVVTSLSFPKKDLVVLLSDFSEGGLGFYPLEIKIVKGEEDKFLAIRYKRLHINKPIPDEIFLLSPPPDFEIIDLKDHGA